MEKLPNSAVAMYVQIYCNKRSGWQLKKHQLMTEATKSWTMLSKSEKLKFINKYKECQRSYKMRLAAYLKNVVPYMKKKDSKRDNTTASNLYLQHANSQISEVSQSDNETEKYPLPAEQIIKNIESNNDNQFNYEVPMHADTLNCDGVSVQESQSEQINTIAIEPTPPRLRNGRELFELLQDKNNMNRIWYSLSRKEKMWYTQAALTLKKEYIKKYKQYLQSLPDRKLFSYYYKTIYSSR